MALFQNSQNIPQIKTFKEIRECLRETNKAGKDEFTYDLKKQLKGRFARFRLFLFLNPNSFFGICILVSLTFIGITSILISFNNSFGVRIFFLFLCTLYLSIPLLLDVITPKFDMEFDARWSGVLNSYQKKSVLSDDQVKHNVKRAFSYYTRQAQPLKFFINLTWGGIFIGCLPDPDFQQAIVCFFMTMSFPKLFEANWFGSLCLVSIPFIYTYYCIHYKIPVIWMENVITQIELRELKTGSIKHPPLWETSTPQERANRWRQWVRIHQEGSCLPDEALRRENMYD